MQRTDSPQLGISRRSLLKVAAAVPVVGTGNALALRSAATWRYSVEPSAEHRAAFEAMFGELIGPFAPVDPAPLVPPGTGRAWFVAAGALRVVLTDTDDAGAVTRQIQFQRA